MNTSSTPNLADLRRRRADRTAEAVNHLGAFVDSLARSILLLLAVVFASLARLFVYAEESWRDEPIEQHPEFKTRGIAAGIVWPDPPEGDLVCIRPGK